MTGYANPLFPIEAPRFLFCYDTSIVRASQLDPHEAGADEQGWPLLDTADQVPVKGYISAPDTRTLAPTGEAVDAAVRYPRGTAVSHRDLIDIPDSNPLPAQLVGRFRVDTVRPTAADVRVTVTRISDPDGSIP